MRLTRAKLRREICRVLAERELERHGGGPVERAIVQHQDPRASNREEHMRRVVRQELERRPPGSPDARR